MAASSRSRPMTARKSPISFLLVLWAWTLPSASSFFQLIGGTCNRDQLTVEHGTKKVILVAALGEKFGFGIPGDIYFPPELLFDLPQDGKKFGHSHHANDQEIDVALAPLFAPRNGTIEGRPLDLAGKSREFGT